MKLKYYISFILLFWGAVAFAQDVKFVAQVSKTTVGTGEQFQLDFTVNGNAENFNPPAFSNFQVLSGPNVSNSMSSINGVTTVSNGISYILIAPKEGEFTIGPASIVANGKKLTTNAIRIKVVKGQPVQQQRSTQQAGGGDSGGIVNGKPGDIAKSLFIRAELDKNNVYQGQQLTVSFKLYTRVGIVDSRLDKMPDLTGFYNQDIKSKTPQQVEWKIETYKGLQYSTAEIRQTILFPEHSGDIKIDPMQMTFLIQQQVKSGDDFMDQFFGGTTKQVQYQVKSAPVIVHVRPLPEAGKPESFTGAVGTFNIDASLDKAELKSNEPLNYKIKVTGVGNIKLLNSVNATFPADFEKYDPKITDTVNDKATTMAGSKMFNYLLIPRHQGDYTIDPVKFSYFNPVTSKCVTLTTKAFKVKVSKGDNETNVTALAGANKQDIKSLGTDIRYIKTGDDDLYKQGEGFFGSGLFYLLLAVGPLFCVGAYQYRNRLIALNSDIVQVKNRRAGKIAAKHMANAQKQLQANKTAEFYEDVFKGMYGYLSDKLNIPYANLDRETIASALKAKSLDEPTINRVLETLDLCEMARFAPVTHITKHEVFEKAKGTINDIENKI